MVALALSADSINAYTTHSTTSSKGSPWCCRMETWSSKLDQKTRCAISRNYKGESRTKVCCKTNVSCDMGYFKKIEENSAPSHLRSIFRLVFWAAVGLVALVVIIIIIVSILELIYSD